MLNHGDAETPIWATAFGWNALPTAWQGRPSPWRDDQNRYDPPDLQAQRTATALEQARQDWPWLGPVLAVHWDNAGLAPDDPARGFALSETPLLAPFRVVATAPPVATSGRYSADHLSGSYSSGWRTALALADVPRDPPRTLVISFQGTRLDLAVNRGAYRGNLWVTIDGQPANALPLDHEGRSYVVLYDPLGEPATVALARNLSPGIHQAVIEAEGGWGQWAIAGWAVFNQVDNQTAQANALLAGTMLVVSGLGLLWQFFPALAAIAGRAWRWSSWQNCFVFHQIAPGERAQVIVVFSLAISF
jgi:hypothetical protein